MCCHNHRTSHFCMKTMLSFNNKLLLVSCTYYCPLKGIILFLCSGFFFPLRTGLKMRPFLILSVCTCILRTQFDTVIIMAGNEMFNLTQTKWEIFWCCPLERNVNIEKVQYNKIYNM